MSAARPDEEARAGVWPGCRNAFHVQEILFAKLYGFDLANGDMCPDVATAIRIIE
jgi:hypothetical protein